MQGRVWASSVSSVLSGSAESYGGIIPLDTKRQTPKFHELGSGWMTEGVYIKGPPHGDLFCGQGLWLSTELTA